MIIRTVGDLIYLVAAVFALIAVLLERRRPLVRSDEPIGTARGPGGITRTECQCRPDRRQDGVGQAPHIDD